MEMCQSHLYTLGGLKRFFTIVILYKLIYLLMHFFSFFLDHNYADLYYPPVNPIHRDKTTKLP